MQVEVNRTPVSTTVNGADLSFSFDSCLPEAALTTGVNKRGRERERENASSSQGTVVQMVDPNPLGQSRALSGKQLMAAVASELGHFVVQKMWCGKGAG